MKVNSKTQVQSTFANVPDRKCSHMEALRSWRMTRASDVEELVRAQANIMEWGRGRFRAGVMATLDSPPVSTSGERSEW
jgi:hypothetical protein